MQMNKDSHKDGFKKQGWNFINTIFSHVKQLSGPGSGITKLQFRTDLP